MYTYQDLTEVTEKNNDTTTMDFVRSIIEEYKRSELYQNAVLAKEYDRRRNRTIVNYRKFFYTSSGRQIPDDISANTKSCSNFFDFFVTQETQYLLGNGVTWQEDSTAGKLGDDFDSQLQDAGKKALVEGESFGFWNVDHLEVFGASEFCPLYDEENGALMAGVRFWKIDSTKPLRATLYELDGLTEYIWDDKGSRILKPKQAYIIHTQTTAIDGTEIYDYENYPTFPIVPLWASDKKQSEIVGMQEDIDSYDLIKSGFANDLDDTAQIYWILKNAGGMDEQDVAEFLSKLRRTHAANLDDGVEAEQHQTDIPYQARETLLNRIRDDLFEQAQAFDPKKIASGGSVVTAAIKAAYQPLDMKCDEFEKQIKDFLKGILDLAGIEGEQPTFTRSMLINQQEQIQTIIQAAQYLPEDVVTTQIVNVLGLSEQLEGILKQKEADDLERLSGQGGNGLEEQEGGSEENPEETDEEAEEDEETKKKKKAE